MVIDECMAGVLHLDIKEGKIWVEQNMTEMRVAQELVERGNK